MNRTTPTQRLTATLLLVCASSAQATVDYCVGTAAQLQTAVNAAENDGDASRITLQAGVYVLAGDLNYNQGAAAGEGALTLRGGGSLNCLIVAPGADGTTIGGLFASTFIQRRGDLLIQNMTFVNVDAAITTFAGFTDSVRVNRVLMLNAMLHVIAPTAEVVVRDSVWANGADLFSVPDFALWINASQANASDPDGIVHLINVSVVEGLARVSGTNRALSVRVTNSIFQRSAAELESSANLVVRNTRSNGIQMLGGATLTSSNVITFGAGLNAQYQPTTNSPMLDRGLSAVYEGLPLFDMYGEARVVGAAVDIGGAESLSDSSGGVIVDTTASSGSGSLAAAVAFANSDSAPNTIRFAIPGPTCPKRIVRTTALIVTDGVVIDGYSQPGSVAPSDLVRFNGEPCILLDGNNRTHPGISTDASLNTSGESVTIKGLAFEDFSIAVQLTAGANHVVQGNQFGGSIGNSSSVLASNDRGILLGTNGSLIGGLSASQANLIAGATGVGISIGVGSDNNAILGNQIGYDGSGIPSTAASNRIGINVNGADNQIVSNRIANNLEDAIALVNAGATGNQIRANRIGANFAFGMPANLGDGVLITSGANNNQIGPSNQIIENATGIRITESAGGGNRIERNSILGHIGLGIDLDQAGVTPNNLDSSICNIVTGCLSNNDQNFPELVSAVLRPATVLIPASLTVAGSLRSLISATPYRIEFYRSRSCDASGFGEGAAFLDAIDSTIANSGPCTANNCTRAFSVSVNPSDVATGDRITAIATASNGDSSEFSACVTVTTSGGDIVFVNGFEGN